MNITDFKIEEYNFINYINLPYKKLYEIWEIRNSDSIRSCMENAAHFSFQNHLDFVDNLRQNNCRDKIYFAIYNRNDNYVISIYFNSITWDEHSAEWGVFINPFFSGKGYAKSISILFFDHILKATTISLIKARVKIDNGHSLFFHQQIGFNIVKITEKYYYLENNLNQKK